MASVTETRLMSAEEFLALPEDGTHRELIRGRLIEEPMTYRNRWHAGTEANVAYLLKDWLRNRPEPRGKIVSGEVGFRLPRDPTTIVGIDVAYVSAEVVAATPESSALFEGAPVLAVEIMSPSDKNEKVAAKVREYLAAGTPVVWVVDPEFQLVVVHRADARPVGLNVTHEIDAEPHLPGFKERVARFFE